MDFFFFITLYFYFHHLFSFIVPFFPDGLG